MSSETQSIPAVPSATTPPATVEAAPRKKSHKLRKFAVWLIVLLMLGGIGYAVFRMLLGPSEGTVMTVLPDKQATPPPVQLEQFDGTNFYFAHPSGYVLRPTRPGDASNPNSLESYNFVMSGIISKLLTVTVTKLGTGKLEDDASYYMRTLHPDLYTLKPQVIQGDKVVIAQDTKEYQLVAFWAHGTGANGKLLTFAISSVSMDTGPTGQEYQQMLESVRWR